MKRKSQRRVGVKPAHRTPEYVILAILLVCSSALILANLGNIYLWQDEAQTALVARTILTHGVPLGYDGVNYFSQSHGVEYGKNYIWKWHPWFPFYVLAAFFALFGTSTFVARLPFALFGIGTVVLTYYCGKSLWKVRRAAVLSAVVLLTSVPFLLLVRQCRYYAPAAFFALAGLYAYSEMLQRRKYASTAFVIASFLLFHTLYVYFMALMAAILTHAVLCRRNRLRSVLITCGVAIAVCLPWVMWVAAVGQTVVFGDMADRLTLSLKYYLLRIGKHIFHPGLLLLPAAAYLLARLRPSRTVSLDSRVWSNVVLLVLFLLATLSGIVLSNQYPFFRYLAPLIPVMCLIAGLCLEQGMRIHPAIGLAVILVLAWKGSMGDYLYEITHDYDGPVERIVNYLRENARPGDLVVANQEDLPIKWYTGLRVVGPLTGEDYKLALGADWIVMRRYVSPACMGFTRYIFRNVPASQFEQITLDFPDNIFENREAPDEHLFRTNTKPADPVVICKRVNQTAEPKESR